MKKLICIAIVLISLFSLMVPAMAAGKKYSDVDMWVNCSNGKTLNVRDVYVNAGAGFVVALTGTIMTMPGLGKTPAAYGIDVDDNGKITGLF